MTATIRVDDLGKRFVLHNQGGAVLDVFDAVAFEARVGEAVVLAGASGVGKSTFLRLLYGNYRPSGGRILILHDGRWHDIVTEVPRTVIEIRRRTLAYVSQFLRVIPRVSTLDIVKDAALARGLGEAEAHTRARDILTRLALPQSLWPLAPATFSGGEQQRVNIARSFVAPAPIMLLDEPTASLDARNRDIVVELVDEARRDGATIVGIFHDEETRNRVATRVFDLLPFKAAA